MLINEGKNYSEISDEIGVTELELITEELKLHNDRMDAKYGQSNVLSTSDAGTRTVGTNNNACCGGCEKQSN